ncbi:MAG: hypothetical protein KC535_01950 [Nanoarchaeota archaeon]|nr:hypothetical protein [Nanoarchaeota archaeon]
MKSKKADTSSMAFVGSIILLLVFLFFATTLYANNASTIKKQTGNLDLGTFLGLGEGEVVTENSQLSEPIPPALLEYVDYLVPALFEQPEVFTNPTDYKLRTNGQLLFIEPFQEYPLEPSRYDHFVIQLTQSSISGSSGITVSVLNTDTSQTLPLYYAKDYDFLQGKKLCVLPGDGSDFKTAAKDALLLGTDRLGYTLNAGQVIASGEATGIGLAFEYEDTGVETTLDFKSIQAYHDNSHVPLLDYDYEDMKLPLYVFKDTVCFFEMEYGGSGVYFDPDLGYPFLNGQGALETDVIREFFNQQQNDNKVII